MIVNYEFKYRSRGKWFFVPNDKCERRGQPGVTAQDVAVWSHDVEHDEVAVVAAQPRKQARAQE